MKRPLKTTLMIGSLVLFALSATCARANMPALSPKPSPPLRAACQKWAANQDEDALYMWGMEEAGGSSNVVAVTRLTNSCLGRKPPEIIGFGSSAGFDEAFCKKHGSAKICQGR